MSLFQLWEFSTGSYNPYWRRLYHPYYVLPYSRREIPVPTSYSTSHPAWQLPGRELRPTSGEWNPQSGSLFFKLPTEIRIIIYNFVSAATTATYRDIERYRDVGRSAAVAVELGCDVEYQHIETDFLLTCGQLYSEARLCGIQRHEHVQTHFGRREWWIRPQWMYRADLGKTQLDCMDSEQLRGVTRLRIVCNSRGMFRGGFTHGQWAMEGWM